MPNDVHPAFLRAQGAAREQARADAAVRALIADARRGTRYATAVEQHVAKLGAAQRLSVITQLFLALAQSYHHDA